MNTAIQTQELRIHAQDFILHPSGAVYWPAQKMLLIADVHLGKITHFRKHGSAVPETAILENFERLDAVVQYFAPAEICFLGDLFHSHLNTEWELFATWVAQTQLPIVLVAGNHDIIHPQRYEKLGIVVVAEKQCGSFLLAHHPIAERTALFRICGHIHPGIRLSGLGKQQLRVPCFYKQVHQLILPAFGTFTGKHLITPQDTDQVYAVTSEEVIPIRYS